MVVQSIVKYTYKAHQELKNMSIYKHVMSGRQSLYPAKW